MLTSEYIDKRIREIVFPVRIVATYGDVMGAENLLKHKPLQITIAERDCTVLRNGEDGEDAAVILDFGKERNAALRCLTFKSEGSRYANVHITLGESVAETISSIGKKNATNDHAIRDFDWILPSFSDMTTQESGFRFACIRLKGRNTRLLLKSLVAVGIYEDLEYKGTFRCSDPKLNDIFDTCAYTSHICIQNYIWDGVKRDRLVWVGDMHPEVLAIRSVFGQIPAVERSMNFIRDNTPLPNWMNTYPTYSAWWLIILHDWYQYSGNMGFLEENRSYAIALMKQLAAHIGDDGSDSLSRYFLDWPCHDKPAEKDGSRAVIAISMTAAMKLAVIYGEKDLARLCDQKRKALLATQSNSYGAKQAAAMLALAGWYDPHKASREILENGAKGWSTFMSYYLLNAAAKCDMAAALQGLKEYYGAMLDLGATSFWEDFDLAWAEKGGRIDQMPQADDPDVHGDNGAFCYQGYRHSLCHGWSAAPAAFLLESVAGIQIMAPGCQEMAIEPNLGDLAWVEATYPTPYGVIKVSHTRQEDGKIATTVDAPKEITIKRGLDHG